MLPRSVRVVPAAALAVCVLLPGCGLLHRHRAPEPPAPIELNTASRRQIEKLPGVTPSMAARIVEGRPYNDASDLVDRHILTEREFRRIADHVMVRRRGE